MSHLLLTGAGFTYNWGGWLASEIEGELLQRVSSDPELQALVQQSVGFEAALGALEREIEQGREGAHERYRRLRDAVLGSFREMNLGLAERRFEFSQDRACSASRFLARFDAIFTLNQDLLLELHYDPSLEDSRHPRWNGRYFPGVSGYQPKTPFKADLIDQRRAVSGPPLQPNPACQPVYKLHGSVDWFDAAGDLLIIGGAKQAMIEKQPLLVEYFSEFRRRLRAPGARLMIIGYGFRDMHVNELLGEACAENPALSAFYVDPHGREVVRGVAGAPSVLPQYTPSWGFMKCIGESRRPLHATFKGDQPEMRKLERFFEPGPGKAPAPAHTP